MQPTDLVQNQVHQRKLSRLFALLDVDGDGRVLMDDYAVLASRTAGVFGHRPGSPAESRLQSVLRKLWHVIHDHPSLCRGGMMTLSQMESDHRRDILNSKAGANVMRPLSFALLSLVDPAATGTVPAEDFRKLLVHGFGVAEADIGRLADLLPAALSYAQVHQLLADFFCSGDANVPGSLLFGPLDDGAAT